MNKWTAHRKDRLTDSDAMNNRQGLPRRMTSLICAVCMIALQCFAIMPALTGYSYADSGKVDFVAKYKDGTEGTQSSSSWISGTGTTTIEIGTDDEGNPIKEEGHRLSDILKNAGLGGYAKVSVNGSSVDPGDSYLIKDGSSWLLFADGGVYDGSVKEIAVSLDKNPVSFSKEPKSDKKKPTVGDTITVSYSLSVDDFFKGSEEYKSDPEGCTALNWEGNNKVSLQTDRTTGTSGSVKAKVKKSGKIRISARSDRFGYLNASATPSAKEKPTTTKATTTRTTTRTTARSPSRFTTHYTTRSGYTYGTYRPSTRSGMSAATRPSITTTATRPTETIPTTQPAFQTMRVKEVYLSEVVPEEDLFYDEEGGAIEEEDWEDAWGEADSPPDSDVSFPAAAGSAAMAIAACGAGGIGRVRRFHLDMGPNEKTSAGKRNLLMNIIRKK